MRKGSLPGWVAQYGLGQGREDRGKRLYVYDDPRGRVNVEIAQQLGCFVEYVKRSSGRR